MIFMSFFTDLLNNLLDLCIDKTKEYDWSEPA